MIINPGRNFCRAALRKLRPRSCGREKAQANSIMQREKTASPLSLLNTSKLMEENEM